MTNSTVFQARRLAALQLEGNEETDAWEIFPTPTIAWSNPPGRGAHWTDRIESGYGEPRLLRRGRTADRFADLGITDMENRRLAALHATRSDDEVHSYFPDCDIGKLYGSTAPWPRLEGCLGILFTSRSGSTFLSRELEKKFALGHIRESFNLPALRSVSREQKQPTNAADALRYSIERAQEGGWFAFKSGGPGLVIAERCGFFDEYLRQTTFLRLLRRDLVAQAVSLAKAQATSIYHSAQLHKRAPMDAVYSFEDIHHALRVILRAVEQLRIYAFRTRRPSKTVVYEDFAGGDFQPVEAICRDFGIPARTSPPTWKVPEIQKIGDRTNEQWCTQFRQQMNDATRKALDKYQRWLER